MIQCQLDDQNTLLGMVAGAGCNLDADQPVIQQCWIITIIRILPNSSKNDNDMMLISQ